MSQDDHSSISLLAGPTASGKTGVVLELSPSTIEVISADAMLVYKGMDIGTAKPSPQEQALLPHHLIDLCHPDEAFSVADYVRLAEEAIAGVLARGKLPIVVGGTGFYIQALMHGLPTVPMVDRGVQQKYWEVFEARGIAPLEQQLQDLSLREAQRAQRNPRRVIRALEIYERTGKFAHQFPYTSAKYRYRGYWLDIPHEELHQAIEKRCEQMFRQGLIDEVLALKRDFPEWATAQQAIGYKEVLECLDADDIKACAKERIVLATRQYAKRQKTWFKKQRDLLALPSKKKALDILAMELNHS